MSVTGKVEDVMDTKVFSIEAEENVMEALTKMIHEGVWSLIVERRGLPEGIVTERDIMRRCIVKGFNPKTMPVEQVMSSPLITIDPDATVGEAITVITQKGLRRLYVVKEGKIIGRITRSGAFRQILDVFMTLSSVPYYA